MDTITIHQAIKGYLGGLNSAHTQHSYGTALGHLCAYLTERGIEADQESASALTVDHAISFVDWLRAEKNPASATLQLYLTAVYRFYRHLLLRGADLSAVDLARLQEVYRDARDIRGEPRPKDPKLAAVQAVIRAARAVQVQPGADQERRRLARLRNIAIVETLRATGCRVGELVGLKLEDISHEGKRALVRGKGSKYRRVYWDDRSWQALMAYLGSRGVQEADKRPVFVGHGNRNDGESLTTRSVSRTIQALAGAAGVKDEVTPHYFRHVFATRALGKTSNLAVVQDLLGHASPVTTRVYAKTDDAQRQEAHGAIWA